MTTATTTATLQQPREDTTDVPDGLRLYLRDITVHALLNAQQEVELAQRIEQPIVIKDKLLALRARIEEGETALSEQWLNLAESLPDAEHDADEAFQHFVRANLRLVVSYAYQFIDRGVPILDLIQEGNIGLMRAVEKYDWRTGFRFSTYAMWWIRQSVQRSFLSQEKIIRIPVHISDELSLARREEERLARRLGRAPTAAEAETASGVTHRRTSYLRNIARQPSSLDAPIRDEDNDNETTTGDILADQRVGPEIVALRGVRHETVLAAVHSLGTREALVVMLRHGLVSGQPLTLLEIGEELGISRERVRQIERQALRKMSQQPGLREFAAEDDEEGE